MSKNVDETQILAWLLCATNQTTSGDLPEAIRIYRYVLGILQKTNIMPMEWKNRCEYQIASLETILTQQAQAYTRAVRRTPSQELDELMEKFYQEGSDPSTLLDPDKHTPGFWVSHISQVELMITTQPLKKKPFFFLLKNIYYS